MENRLRYLNMEINFICNYINTREHIFWLHKATTFRNDVVFAKKGRRVQMSFKIACIFYCRLFSWKLPTETFPIFLIVYFHESFLLLRRYTPVPWKWKESWLMSMASPENEQISNVFISFWIPCSLVMNVWLEIYCPLYEFQQTIFKWMNS